MARESGANVETRSDDRSVESPTWWFVPKACLSH
jgi:hypothetical protein